MRLIKKNLLITGLPGVGKTTLIKKLSEALKDFHPVGFYTEEIREGGERKGFELISLDGKKGLLSHKDLRSPNTVGRYKVDIKSFEDFLDSISFFNPLTRFIIIDEIGKMECLSEPFKKLEMFSEDRGRARRLYRDYMLEGEEVKREDVYSTVSQRVLGGEEFVKEVFMKTGRAEVLGKRRHEYTLLEIGGAVERVYGVPMRQLREKSKDEGIVSGRKLMSLVAREYGYKGQEIAEYLRRDPAVITRYSKEGKRLEDEVEKVHEVLKKTNKVNKQV